MTKELIYIINELTERGLTKESEHLYSVFIKTAYDTAARAEALFNLANPKGNASANERFMAARNLGDILRNPDKIEFGYKELAKIILNPDKEVDSNLLLKEWGPEGWGVLEAGEVEVLRLILNPEEDLGNNEDSVGSEDDEDASQEESWRYESRSEEPGYRRRRGQRRYEEEVENERSRQNEERDRIMSVLNRFNGTVQTVRIKRTRGVSDAHVSNIAGEVVTFIVPVDETTLGYKVLALDDLVSDDFIDLNSKHFKKREWRF
jgi:hypothetical protein